MKRMLIVSYLRFSYFHLVSLDFIHFVCHLSLQPPIFRGWRFNIFNLCKHSKSAFSCKTCFFIIFERSAFIWINLPSSAGIDCHQNSRPAQVHRSWSSWWVPFFGACFPDEGLPSVADAVVLFFYNNVRGVGLLHRLGMYLTTYLYGHNLSMMLFASKYTLVPVVCGHLSFVFISSFSALHIASSTCGSKMDGS